MYIREYGRPLWIGCPEISSCPLPLRGKGSSSHLVRCAPAHDYRCLGWGGSEPVVLRCSCRFCGRQLPLALWIAKAEEARSQREWSWCKEKERDGKLRGPCPFPVPSSSPFWGPSGSTALSLLRTYNRAQFLMWAWLELASIICRDRQGKLYLQTHCILPSPSGSLESADLPPPNQLVQSFQTVCVRRVGFVELMGVAPQTNVPIESYLWPSNLGHLWINEVRLVSQHLVHLKLTPCYMSIVSQQSWEKETCRLKW